MKTDQNRIDFEYFAGAVWMQVFFIGEQRTAYEGKRHDKSKGIAALVKCMPTIFDGGQMDVKKKNCV